MYAVTCGRSLYCAAAAAWTAISHSVFAWERDALEFARRHLPDYDPWRAWSNFEFIDDEGRVNEVDLLVLTQRGLSWSRSNPGPVPCGAMPIVGPGPPTAGRSR
jgi:hypothetical protein